MTPIEKSIHNQLKSLQTSGITHGYEDTVIQYTTDHLYTPDFTISLPDGRRIYIECKGWLRPEDRQKMLKVKYQNPDLDIRFVFEKDNPLKNKKSKITYTQWAERHGFPSCVGEIPKEWLV